MAKRPLFFEKQKQHLCGQHAINNLLQKQAVIYWAENRNQKRAGTALNLCAIVAAVNKEARQIGLKSRQAGDSATGLNVAVVEKALKALELDVTIIPVQASQGDGDRGGGGGGGGVAATYPPNKQLIAAAHVCGHGSLSPRLRSPV
jgi:hypothetical protein